MTLKEIAKKLTDNGLQHRDSQVEMIEAIFDAVRNNQILCIEAPTGTGKTLSYCLGSYLAKKDKQTIIISTATIALQEQLFEKDLPLLTQILDAQIKYALAKGRRRYICHSRLFNPDLLDNLANDDSLRELRYLLENKQWDGDRDQLEVTISDDDWQKISTDSNGCTGKHCDFYDECAFYKARKKLHSAEIIIANHSLLLADLTLGSGSILPEMEKNIYIIDECHHLPTKSLDHFAKYASAMGSVEWLNTLTKALTKAVIAKEVSEAIQNKIKECSHQLVRGLKDLNTLLESNSAQFQDDIWRLQIPNEGLLALGQAILSDARTLCSLIEGVVLTLENTLEQHKSSDKERAADLSKRLTTFSFVLSRAENLYQTWQQFCHQRQSNEAPIARWFAKRNEHYYCHTSPINVSQQLKELFWKQLSNSAILCSATLRSLGSFADFRRQAGLNNHANLMEKAISSTFDYKKSLLYLPAMKYAPAGLEQAKHSAEVVALLPELILPRAGTLVLFTSRKVMQQTYEQLPMEISKDILLQGTQSKIKLVAQHKKQIIQGKRSILFGLASFGEGLDLPAELCQHVIINKLPFAVPSTPIELTRNEWLAVNQRNPFMLATLPATSIKLIQYVGRLIRQEQDYGIVTILDKRLYSKQYGLQLLNSLPPFTQVINEKPEVMIRMALVRDLF